MMRSNEDTKKWVEEKYAKPDPWGYQRTEDDSERRARVIAACILLAPQGAFRKALDVGCGEAWITAGLPAEEKFGLELSDAAAARFPEDVTRVLEIEDGAFDLVVSTETMFEHYDWQAISDSIIRAVAPGGVIVTCNNTKWEVGILRRKIGEPCLCVEFPYKGMVHSLKAWRV
jgi:SAM-dependent methyltransferase